MEQIRVLYRLVVMVTCVVCLGFSGGMCSEFDPLIKTYVSSSSSQLSNENLVYSGGKLKDVHSIIDPEWDSLVTQSELPVMVVFTAQWCAPCRVMVSKLNELDSRYKNKFKFYTVDFDFETRIGTRFDVSSLPTTLVFKGGDLMTKFIGLNTHKLERLVKEYM